MGTLNHFFGSLKSEKKRGKQLIESNRYKRWQTTKYYILIASLVAALLGTGVVGWLDPISLLVRSLGLSILPGTNYALRAVLHGLEGSQIRAGAKRGQRIALSFRLAAALSFKQPYFRQGIWLGAIFIFLLALNFRVTRFWCRALCPLGALLGVASRWSVLGLVKTPRALQGLQPLPVALPGRRRSDRRRSLASSRSAISASIAWVSAPSTACSSSFFPGKTSAGVNLQRRKVLTSLGAGAALVPLMRATPGFATERHERLAAPTRSLGRGIFPLALHTMRGMHEGLSQQRPASRLQRGGAGRYLDAGAWFRGLATAKPVVCSAPRCVPRARSGRSVRKKRAGRRSAIQDAKPIRLGTAFYDRGRCLPWAMATECIVCEEWCPTSPKAIYLKPAEVVDAEGKVKQVKQPYLDPARCVGCGACEYACPVQDRPAVYVTSVGESRSRTNQILLNRGKETAK